jgi:hypothetical protein
MKLGETPTLDLALLIVAVVLMLGGAVTLVGARRTGTRRCLSSRPDVSEIARRLDRVPLQPIVTG